MCIINELLAKNNVPLIKRVYTAHVGAITATVTVTTDPNSNVTNKTNYMEL